MQNPTKNGSCTISAFQPESLMRITQLDDSHRAHLCALRPFVSVTQRRRLVNPIPMIFLGLFLKLAQRRGSAHEQAPSRPTGECRYRGPGFVCRNQSSTCTPRRKRFVIGYSQFVPAPSVSAFLRFCFLVSCLPALVPHSPALRMLDGLCSCVGSHDHRTFSTCLDWPSCVLQGSGRRAPHPGRRGRVVNE